MKIKRRRRKLRATLADRLDAYREKRKARRDRKRTRREIAELEQRGVPVPDSLREREESATKRLLRANHRIDEANDRIAALRAKLARAAKAARARNRVYSRAEWGARAPRGSYSRQGAVSAGVQHHDAYPALSPNATVAEEAAHMRAIQAGHFARGFTDIGYQEVTFPSGRTYAGRPAWAVPAGAIGHNTGYAHWSCNGNYENDQPTDALLAGCHGSRERLAPGLRLYGHGDLNPTACPGRNLKPHLGKEI